MESWGTYFSFISGHEPTKDNIKFYINDSYAEMLKIPHDPNLKDEHGWVDIPSKFTFWIVLYDGKLYFLSSRRGVTIRIIDEFSLQDCSDGYLDLKGNKHSGVEELEKFGDGYCLKIKLKENPVIKLDIYVVCLENEELRNAWVKKFSAVRNLYTAN